MKNTFLVLWLTSTMFMFSACTPAPEPKPVVKPISETKALRVTATAYTSSKKETDKTPFLAAWKNRLKPGIKSIAVSRDLLDMGLGNGSIVTIDGLEGNYKVLDKMNKRWQKKIDIYMGLNRKRALRWGKKGVTIRWKKSAEELQEEYTLAKQKAIALEKDRNKGVMSYVNALFTSDSKS